MPTANPTANQAYTKSFRAGMIAAANDMPRDQAVRLAQVLTIRDGDAFLAGYDAELRKQRTAK